MSEVPQDTSSRPKDNESGPNYLGYYKKLVLDIFSQNEVSIVPLLGDSVVPGGSYSEEAKGTCNDDQGEKNSNYIGPLSYFTGRVGGGLSEFKKERLRGILNDTATFLNEEVDEIVDHILARLQIQPDPREEKLLPCHLSASDEETRGPNCSKKRKASSLVSSNSCSHAGILSPDSHRELGILEQHLEDFLNVLVSKCRPMTRAEKQQLGKKIQKLPQRALDRVVELIQPSSFSARHMIDSIPVNLAEQDDATLWRLYYYVETVAKANGA